MRKSKSFVPVKALYWSSQISTMSIEMGLLIGAGYWADSKWGTSPWFLLLGCSAGLLVASWQLFRLVRSMTRPDFSEQRDSSEEFDGS